MPAELDFLQLIDILSKTKAKKAYSQKAKRLLELALKHTNCFYPYRLALELDRRGYPISELEDHIIQLATYSHWNLYYLVIFAKNITGANLEKLQRAVIKINNPELMAEFSTVKDSDKDHLEQLILSAKRPRASYLFLTYHKEHSLKHFQILISSKKSKYLYKCACLTKEAKEFSKIEDLLLKNRSIYYIRLLATQPLANQTKIEDRIISTLDLEEIKKLYQQTKSDRLIKYLLVM